MCRRCRLVRVGVGSLTNMSRENSGRRKSRSRASLVCVRLLWLLLRVMMLLVSWNGEVGMALCRVTGTTEPYWTWLLRLWRIMILSSTTCLGRVVVVV